MKSYMRTLAMMAAHCQRGGGYPALNYTSPADFVLDRGVDHAATSSALTGDELRYLKRVAKHTRLSFEPKLCFTNAMTLVAHDAMGRLTYCEGYCYSGVIAVHHGWVTLAGKVVDLTRSTRPESAAEYCDGVPPQADLMDRILGAVPEGWQYLGVEFSKADVLSYMVKLEQTGSIIDNWESGWPLFKKPRLGNEPAPDPEAWAHLTQRATQGAASA